MLRLQTIVSREIAAAEAAVVTIGVLQAGTKENRDPNEAIIKLNVGTSTSGGVPSSRENSMKIIQTISACTTGTDAKAGKKSPLRRGFLRLN